MVFNATFNNILVISWRSVLMIENTGELGENEQPAASNRQTCTTSVTICADYICSYKSSYYAITTTTAPMYIETAMLYL